MTAANSPASNSAPRRPDFGGLVAFRREWRAFHERQDRESADHVFRLAGVELVTDGDLKFFPDFFRTKLNEFGRDWERALAAQGLREGFSFYRVSLLISIDQVKALHSWIESALVGKGAALFFESNGIHAVSGGTWDSIFYFTLRADSDPDSLGLESAIGIQNAGKILRIA